MTRPSPTLGERARGALLGLAAGNALGVPTEFLGSSDAIRAAFPDGVRDIPPVRQADSPFDDDTAMTLLLAEELLEPQLSLERLAGRWIGWMDSDGRGIGVQTRSALNHIRTHGSPPAGSGGIAGNGAVMRCLPVALATLGSPANLVSGSYHTAAITHPDDRCTWGAVAVNVAAAELLKGRRDFLADVLEVLRINEAPPVLLDAVRRVPLERREELPLTGPEPGYVVHCVEIGLWFAWHEPNLERGLIWLANAGGDTDTNAAVAGALMGARDGEAAIPARWIAALPQVERLRELATRLVGQAA
ncbi:MAG TPA: ADP-ribosylglycohydrolase family protein [Gemmatimonadales bacterium]|nr:ADP-ribosylglycohydrolase family protein [Gemmatimonadales bacterium]